MKWANVSSLLVTQ